MSTRQYVGARYVPILADPFEWDMRKTYEHFTIVGYNNYTYISRKNVPANTDINNTEYWVNMGSFNAQIEAERITNDNQWLVINSLLKNSFIMRNQVNGFSQKILVIGDSYNDESRAQYSENSVTVWGKQLLDLFGKGKTAKNIGESGAGWSVAGSNTQSTFRDLVVANHTYEDTYDKIIICGGLNDIIKDNGDLSVVPSEIASTVSYAKTINPDVQIYIGVCGYTMNPNQYKMKELIKTINSVTGVDYHFIDGVQYAMKGKEYLLSDLIHPTNEGEKRIAEAIYQGIRGYKINHFYEKSYNLNNSTTGSQIMQFGIVIENDIAKMLTYDVNPSLTGFALNISGATRYQEIDVGVIDNFDFVVSPNIPASERLYCTCESGWRITNAVGTNLSTNATENLGTVRCDVALRWLPKTIWENGIPKTHLIMTVAASHIKSNGDYVVIKQGEFVGVGRSPIAMNFCRSMRI